jgi:hypothetical protein
MAYEKEEIEGSSPKSFYNLQTKRRVKPEYVDPVRIKQALTFGGG